MSRVAKLKLKLTNGSITARELRALFELEGWQLERTRGSHEFWIKGAGIFVLATHGKDLKLYQIKQARGLLIDGDNG